MRVGIGLCLSFCQRTLLTGKIVVRAISTAPAAVTMPANALNSPTAAADG